MIEESKLFQLKPGQKRRKLALTLENVERSISGGPSVCEIPVENRRGYLRSILKIVRDDPKLLAAEKSRIEVFLENEDFDEKSACNFARNALLRILQVSVADWNLVVAPHDKEMAARKAFEGMQVFVEDLRSPFNLGSIFRSAEAFGVEKIWLSPLCCDENHARAQRSAMGCVDAVPHERCDLADLRKKTGGLPIFALETGGTDIGDFAFPEKGVVILGSEELGVSPDALKIADAGIATIPLFGAKSSLNVGVAFGVLLAEWTKKLKAT